MNDKQLTSLQLNVPNDINLLKTEKTDRYRIIHGFGSSDNMGSVVNDISNTGDVYAWPQGVFKPQVVSDDANDNASGDGARSVMVKGLGFIGSNLIDIEEEIPTDGTNPVPAKKNFFRVNESFVEKSGVYATTTALSHQGNLTISTFGGALVHSIIKIDNDVSLGEAEIGRYSIPSNAKGWLQVINVSTASNMATKYFVWKRNDLNVTAAPFSSKRLMYTAPPFVGQSNRKLTNAFELDPNTDFWFSGESPLGANNEVAVDFELTLKYFDFDFVT